MNHGWETIMKNGRFRLWVAWPGRVCRQEGGLSPPSRSRTKPNGKRAYTGNVEKLDGRVPTGSRKGRDAFCAVTRHLRRPAESRPTGTLAANPDQCDSTRRMAFLHGEAPAAFS